MIAPHRLPQTAWPLVLPEEAPPAFPPASSGDLVADQGIDLPQLEIRNVTLVTCPVPWHNTTVDDTGATPILLRAPSVIPERGIGLRRHEESWLQPPHVIYLPSEVPVVPLLPAPRISPRPDLEVTEEGRILRRVRLEEEEAQWVRDLESGIDTKDLGEAAELLRSHDEAYYRQYLNSCMDAYRMKDQYLYGQDGYKNLTSFIKASAVELGVSVGDFYRRVAAGEVLDRFMAIVLMGQWGLTKDEIAMKVPRLSYILTAYYRHVPFEEMKGPFLNWPYEDYVAFMVGRKPKSQEEKNADKSARYNKEKDTPPVLTPTDTERQIVSIIKKGLDAKPVGLDDLSHVPYLEKAQLAYRRELTDIAYENRDPEFYKTERTCTEVKAIHTLADAKYMFKLHLAKGVPNRLVCCCLSAQIDTVPELIAQRETLKYKNTHDYLVKEIGVSFDTYRAIKIGRNYLKHEKTMLRLLGNINSEVKLGMLFSFDCAVDNHGDQPELIKRFFRPETPLTDWEAFATHRDYEKYLSNNRMSRAKIKEARRIIFEFNEAKKRSLPSSQKTGFIGGDRVAIFPIVLDAEKSFLDRCLRDLAYLRKYVEKYAWYKENGLLP